MRKLKVAFFADCLIRDYDGAIRTIYQLIDRIPNMDFEFLFITGEKPNEKLNHQILELPSLRLPVNHNYKMTLSFLVKNRLNKSLEAFAPEIIHLTTPSPLGFSGLQYANAHGIPVISIYHTNFLSYIDFYLQKIPFLIPPAKNYLISQLQSFYNNCNVVYLPSMAMKKELTQIGVFSHHMTIWKRGLKEGVFSPKKRDLNYIRQITGNDNPNLIFASRLVWEKNLETLIRIYKQIEDQQLGVNLLIAGEGYAQKEMKAQMPKAFFLGNLNHEQLSIAYASAEVFVFPSVSETYGNVVNEAMASGLPCVIANGGGTVEFIQQGENGYLCDPFDENDYLSKIKLILQEDQIRQKFIAAGLSQTRNLSWQALTDKYFSDLKSLASLAQLKTA